MVSVNIEPAAEPAAKRPTQLARPFAQWCVDMGFSRCTGYRLANLGLVKTIRVGGRRLITEQEIQRILREGVTEK